MHKHWKAIAAMAQNRVIGRDNAMPWHLPEDFKFFKQQTMGQVLAMGRKTFESIGRPLPGRQTLVLSRRADPIEGVTMLGGLEALENFDTDKDIYISGGAEIYAQTLPLCAELYLTRVRATPEGDAHFPPFEDFFQEPKIILETSDFQVEHYVRR